MEALLNRWRGTGDIFNIYKFHVTGTMIYAVYLALLFGLVTQNVTVGVITLIGFLIGESFGWGKWVGALCYPETKKDLEKEYEDKEGYGFPYIHYMANFFIKEKDNFFAYCNLALFIRGMIWALCLYLALFIYGYISYFEYFFISIIWGVGFPFACYLSRKKSFNYKSKFISIVGKWETQEIYYGIIHMIVNMYLVYTIIN